FVKLAASLPKKQMSLYMHLHTGHTPLNKHLHQLKQSNTPTVKYRTSLESMHHFLFQCPRYDREWYVMQRALGRDATSLSFLLSNPKAHPHLLKYVDTTKCFHHVLGEVHALEHDI
ncbi:hypothetical protein M404DRAFT_93986, partial [Pisolithus tinctorius Marx 270]